jgi:hypothetical protein
MPLELQPKHIKTSWLWAVLLLLLASSCYDADTYFKVAEDRIQKYRPKRKDLAIVVDYRKNIFRNRLYLLDMHKREVILSSQVSHAGLSGLIWVWFYSNKMNSNRSSKGNFITKNAYIGRFGRSMQIQGLDKGVNDNALPRSVVFHSDRKMSTLWSDGCFATPDDVNRRIIDMAQGGVLVCVID